MKNKGEVQIPDAIITELKFIQTGMMIVAREDTEVVRKIVESALLIGKGENLNSVRDNVYEAYPNIYENPEFKDKSMLLNFCNYLNTILTLKHRAFKVDFSKVDPSELRDYKFAVRDKIEQAMLRIFYPGDYENEDTIIIENHKIEDTTEADIIGNLAHQLDDMDI